MKKYPEKEERLKVLMWNFIKLKFEFAIIKKLDYDFTSFKELEDFYEEVFECYGVKFEKNDTPQRDEEAKTAQVTQQSGVYLSQDDYEETKRHSIEPF